MSPLGETSTAWKKIIFALKPGTIRCVNLTEQQHDKRGKPDSSDVPNMRCSCSVRVAIRVYCALLGWCEEHTRQSDSWFVCGRFIQAVKEAVEVSLCCDGEGRRVVKSQCISEIFDVSIFSIFRYFDLSEKWGRKSGQTCKERVIKHKQRVGTSACLSDKEGWGVFRDPSCPRQWPLDVPQSPKKSRCFVCL